MAVRMSHLIMNQRKQSWKYPTFRRRQKKIDEAAALLRKNLTTRGKFLGVNYIHTLSGLGPRFQRNLGCAKKMSFRSQGIYEVFC
jgi:hypothetical protein